MFGIEKGLRSPISIEMKDGRIYAQDESGQPCDYVITDEVYEVYNFEALEKIEYDRYYPAIGYYKQLS